MQRLKERDKKWNSNVVKNWDKLELTVKQLMDGNYKFDLVLNGDLEVEENVQKVIEFLKSRKILS